MKCEVTLFVLGHAIASYEVELTNDQAAEQTREDVLQRELELKAELERIRVRHFRSILKYKDDYRFMVTFQSKLNHYGSDEDFK